MAPLFIVRIFLIQTMLTHHSKIFESLQPINTEQEDYGIIKNSVRGTIAHPCHAEILHETRQLMKSLLYQHMCYAPIHSLTYCRQRRKHEGFGWFKWQILKEIIRDYCQYKSIHSPPLFRRPSYCR